MRTAIKSLCILVLLAIVPFSAVKAQIGLGIQAGYVNSYFYSDIPLLPMGDKAYNGFEIGVTYDMPIQGGVYMNYSFLYTNISNSRKYDAVTIKNTGHYLNLPVRIGYRYTITDYFRVFGYAGPNFTLGIGGKTTGDILGLNTDGKWYGDDSHMTRFDVKLGLGIGVQYSSVALKIGYDWGLIDNYDIDDMYLRRNQLNISLAYMF